MSKTKRKQPDWLREDERWLRKGGVHKASSRKKQKQDFLREIEEVTKDERAAAGY